MEKSQVSNFLDDIKIIQKKIEQKKVVFICGSGVSLAVIKIKPKNLPLSWTGLLKHGAEFIANRIGENPLKFYDPQNDVNTFQMIESAERITQVLMGIDQFNAWIKSVFSNLDDIIIYNHPLLLTLKRFWGNGNIIATTNYDDILCKAFNTHFFCLSKDPTGVQELLSGDMTGILHLHGHYLQPETVVFGQESYQKITRDKIAQQFMDLLAKPYTSVFLGLGDGLNDPNFSSFIDRINFAYKGSSRNWYILARDCDVADLKKRYSDHHCIILNYGTDFKDLPIFLSQISPPSKVQLIQQELICNIDYFQNINFIGRTEILAKINMGFTEQNRDLTIQVLAGLGGVGKTQVVLKYIYSFREKYKIIWWINAENDIAISDGFYFLAKKIGISCSQSPKGVFQTIRIWLEQNTGWLIIYDNADSQEMFLAN